MRKYQPKEIEPKQQKKWQELQLNKVDLDKAKKPYYLLIEFPYPSGDLHVGHWLAFAVPDILARLKRMQGYDVFMPLGFDAFGLPAENAAIKRGIHPEEWTMGNIKTMTEQFKLIGGVHDFEHMVISCLPEYYKWNQWIFLKFFEKGLAYRGKFMSNWCPSCQTVLANEGVEGGRCWRCDTEVVQKEIEQWFLRITDYADQLIWDNPPQVDWPKSIRDSQNNWIGKSEGIQISFRVQGTRYRVEVYTVYPETIFGVTYLVLAPEHPLVPELTTPDQKGAVNSYIEEAKKKSELERKSTDKDKSGVFTGSYVVNPANGEEVPVWVADYVIGSYGTGAVMGVPASDHRDFAFAKKYSLPVVRVVGQDAKDTSEVKSEEQVLEEGVLVNSGEFSGLTTPESARGKIMDWIEKKEFGKRSKQYHLHDWSISRQRYWGTPVPIINCPDCGPVPVPESDLPVVLPKIDDYLPKGQPPLAQATDWVNIKCPKCGGEGKRETETLDTFFDSSWYFLRFMDPDDQKRAFDPDLVKKWLPVDIYIGGAEHTLGHTLYSRFFIKFFKDLGLLEFSEYAKKRVNHGVILGPDGARMSKSHGNVVSPDEQVALYGADAVRMYLGFIGPYSVVAPWNPDSMNGVHHFLERVWGLCDKLDKNLPKSDKDKQLLARAASKISQEVQATKFNTAIATLMESLNYFSRQDKISFDSFLNYLILLAPFAPHLTDQLWQDLGQTGSIHQQSWPEVDNKLLLEEEIKVAVQVNGRMREIILVDSDIVNDESEVVRLALASEKVQKYLDKKEPKKVIYVPGKVVSLVI